MSRRLVFPLAAVAVLALAAFIFLGVGNPLSTASSESVEQTSEPTLAEAPEPVEEEADEEASNREAEEEASQQEAEAEQSEDEREAEAEEQAAAEEAAAEQAATEEEAAAEQAAAEQAAAEQAAAEQAAAEAAALEQAAAEEAAAQEAAAEQAAAEEAVAAEEAAVEEAAPAPPASGDLSLTVPKMGRYNDPVFNTESEEALHNGAIKLPSTGFPWEPGSNTYIAAHVYGYEGTGSWQQFAGLPSMTHGDAIFLTDANGATYEYQVTEIMTVMPTDVWVAAPEAGRDMVSLQTCVGPGWSERLVVRADRV